MINYDNIIYIFIFCFPENEIQNNMNRLYVPFNAIKESLCILNLLLKYNI